MACELRLLSSHGAVLLLLARNPAITLRDIAAETGLTERRVYQVVSELHETGAVGRVRRGRNNLYALRNLHAPLHPGLDGLSLRDFVALVGPRHGASDPAPHPSPAGEAQ